MVSASQCESVQAADLHSVDAGPARAALVRSGVRPVDVGPAAIPSAPSTTSEADMCGAQALVPLERESDANLVGHDGGARRVAPEIVSNRLNKLILHAYLKFRPWCYLKPGFFGLRDFKIQSAMENA